MKKYINLFYVLCLLCSIGFLLSEYVKSKEYIRDLENRELRLFYSEGTKLSIDTIYITHDDIRVLITGKDLEAYPIFY